ncbi:hypothetical protein OQA88_1086 [Cercophora sp. LCS_1]
MTSFGAVRRALVALFLSAAWGSCTTVTNETDIIDIATNRTFDYVIAGAGLSGLTVGNKLSGAGFSVLIIEAGPDGSWNPAISYAEDRVWGDTFCNWKYPAYAENGTQLKWKVDSGACIGGSTSINGMVWYRPAKAELDKLESLGNPGWNWNNLLPYFEASERVIPPSPDQVAQGAGTVPGAHGSDGVVNTSYPTPLSIPKAVNLYKQAVSLTFPGLAVGEDLSDRDSVSSATTLYTVWYDPATGKHRRSSAADGYLWDPNQQRAGLFVLTTHKIDKVLFRNDTTATGVSFLPTNSSSSSFETLEVYARKGVILSAGSLASAPILERSGIGRSDVLKAAGIEQLIDLPGVGANLNDQPGTGTSALVAEGYQSDTGIINKRGFFAPEISLISVNELWPGVPVVELLADSGGETLFTAFWPLLTLSRGHIHIDTSDPLVHPLITPRLLEDSFDAAVAISIARASRSVFSSPPFKGIVANAYYDPAIGPNGTDAEYLAWYKSSMFGASHWIGSTSMMPRHLGGVVDHRLRVYGTKQLRVVDAGILPLQLTSHTMSTLYAVSARAADLILDN